ncbi:MAG TPA: ABC transporter ATP-binding protein [Candidatus Omnitrophota bacterium]|nr:ABC transporter ATP-binding protein [Candidatus Omnitrophota bacterium]
MSSVKAVEIRNLSFCYPDGKTALNDISFELNPGERVAIMGGNGAGKSTLLMCLNGVLQGTGEILICGMPVVKKNYKPVRQKVGLLFQNADDQLFCPTVYDDVAFGLRNRGEREEVIRRKVAESLHAVGLDGFERRNAFHLSVGEKKRVALATALCMDVEVMALDEPTSSLDPRGKRELTDLLKRYSQAQMIATHDLRLARELCQRIIVLKDGRKIADAEAGKILNQKELIASAGLE